MGALRNKNSSKLDLVTGILLKKSNKPLEYLFLPMVAYKILKMFVLA